MFRRSGSRWWAGTLIRACRADGWSTNSPAVDAYYLRTWYECCNARCDRLIQLYLPQRFLPGDSKLGQSSRKLLSKAKFLHADNDMEMEVRLRARTVDRLGESYQSLPKAVLFIIGAYKPVLKNLARTGPMYQKRYMYESHADADTVLT